MNVTATPTALAHRLRHEWDDRLAHEIYDLGDELGEMTGRDALNHVQHGHDRDATLIALLREHHAGNPIAARIVVQAFLPAAISHAHRSRSTRAMWRHNPEDAIVTTISALWEAVHTYPLEKTMNVAGNLRWALTSIVHTSFSGHENELAVTDEQLDELVEPRETEDAFKELITIFTWAVETGAITREEIQLLARIELADSDPGQARDDAAFELGISRETLNRRVHRIRTRLMTAVCGDVSAKVGYAPKRTA